MGIIRNLKIEDDLAEGTFDSKSLFSGEMSVNYYTDEGTTEQDAESCISHYNSLNDKKDIIDSINQGLEKYFLFMYDQWREMDDYYADIVKSLKPLKKKHKAGDDLISYLSASTLVAYPSNEGEVGYGLECECPWEPEHGVWILIRGDKVVYVGPFEGQTPWDDEDELYCIWDEE